MDIVIPTIRDLDFLEEWRPYFEDHHLIIIQDGDPERDIRIPEGFSYDHYNRNDIEEDLGENSWIISKKDSACRCYGFLKADSKYVYTLDDDCFPAENPEGIEVNAVKEHKSNLGSTSHPSFFNTLYNQKLVGGFPYERRSGQPTAISHGLWLNIPDFGAPGQMADPDWRNDKYADAVVTVPYETMFPMCGMNLAFDQELIGPAMYFGLMGQNQPLSRHGDMFAGWCAKKVCDHLNYGVKSGKPYIWHEKQSDMIENFKKEYKGTIWENKIISAYENFEFSREHQNAAECYLELAEFTENELSDIDPYFEGLGEAMRIWIKEWRERK